MTDAPTTHPLSPRLRELSDAVTQGREAVAREFTMRVPAEPDRDADLVLSRAADDLDRQQAALSARDEALAEAAADIARCAGVNIEGDWREGCETCRRRTDPPVGDRQVWMRPPVLIVFECPHLIEGEPTP